MLTRQEQNQNKSVCKCPVLEDVFAKTQKISDGIIPGQTIWTHSFFIGKISPVFSVKLLSHVTCNVPDWYEELKKYQDFAHDSKFRHEVISGVFFSDKSWQISRIVGQHHGKFVAGAGLPIDCDVYGGQDWNVLRQQLEEKLSLRFCPPGLKLTELYNSFKDISSAQLSAVSGLTTISDWLASSDLLCAAYEDGGEVLVSQKLEELGFQCLRIKKDISFDSMFGFKPNTVQREFIGIVEPGGVFVLEAPMGIGKISPVFSVKLLSHVTCNVCCHLIRQPGYILLCQRRQLQRKYMRDLQHL